LTNFGFKVTKTADASVQRATTYKCNASGWGKMAEKRRNKPKNC
jgi:hypothetical protein